MDATKLLLLIINLITIPIFHRSYFKPHRLLMKASSLEQAYSR